MKLYFNDENNTITSVNMITGVMEIEPKQTLNFGTANYKSLKGYTEKFRITFPFPTDGNKIIVVGFHDGYYDPNNINDLPAPFKYNLTNSARYMSKLVKNMIIKPRDGDGKFLIEYDYIAQEAEIKHDSNGYFLQSCTKRNDWIFNALNISNKKINELLGRESSGIWPYGSKKEIYLLIDYINCHYSNNDNLLADVNSDRFFFNNRFYDYKKSKKDGWYIKTDLKLLADYLHISVQDVRERLCEYSNSRVGVFPEFKTKKDLINGLKKLLNVHKMLKS